MWLVLGGIGGRLWNKVEITVLLGLWPLYLTPRFLLFYHPSQLPVGSMWMLGGQRNQSSSQANLSTHPFRNLFLKWLLRLDLGPLQSLPLQMPPPISSSKRKVRTTGLTLSPQIPCMPVSSSTFVTRNGLLSCGKWLWWNGIASEDMIRQVMLKLCGRKTHRPNWNKGCPQFI